MSVLDRIQSILRSSTSPDPREYECTECGNTFESMKEPKRATCMECLSDDVTVIE